MEMAEEIIRYEHVDICYNGQKTVKDISFKVNKGEVLGIAGESGSGKSTLVKAAVGILGKEGMVTRGEIIYNGLNLPDLSAKEMLKICGPEIGMIFQTAGGSFCPIRTIEKQLYEYVTQHTKMTKKEFKEKATEIFSKFGFTDVERVLKSYPFELSGGMQQRVGIAAAMLLNPKLLLADEPTAALDVCIQKQVVEEMLMVQKMFGTSIILVTHNLGIIKKMADHVLIMKNGSMVEYGTTQEVFRNPQAEYTRKLIDAVPQLRR